MMALVFRVAAGGSDLWMALKKNTHTKKKREEERKRRRRGENKCETETLRAISTNFFKSLAEPSCQLRKHHLAVI